MEKDVQSTVELRVRGHGSPDCQIIQVHEPVVCAATRKLQNGALTCGFVC